MLEKALTLPLGDAYDDYVFLDVLDGLDALNESWKPRAPPRSSTIVALIT